MEEADIRESVAVPYWYSYCPKLDRYSGPYEEQIDIPNLERIDQCYHQHWNEHIILPYNVYMWADDDAWKYRGGKMWKIRDAHNGKYGEMMGLL